MSSTLGGDDVIILTPGEPVALKTSENVRPGRGVYVAEDGQMTSAVVGRVVIENGIVEVISVRNDVGEVLPSVGASITGRVLRVTSKMCDVQILCVGDTPVRGAGFKGTLRKENVRAFEVDQIDMLDCFRIGDIIVATVAALGGARSYELSTAGNHLGVIHATCAISGEQMLPASWESMRCPITGIIEKRKVAHLQL